MLMVQWHAVHGCVWMSLEPSHWVIDCRRVSVAWVCDLTKTYRAFCHLSTELLLILVSYTYQEIVSRILLF